MKSRIVLVVTVLLLALSVFGVQAQDQSIAEVAAGNPDFSTLVSLVEAAGLTDVLSSEGPYTVFAPNNDAFAKLPAFVLEYLGSHPEALTRVLTYHVVGGAVMAADITESMMADSMEMASVGGEMTGSQLDVQVTDMGVTVNGAHVIAADIAASNGVIHVIDEVLIPWFELPEVVPAVVTGDIAIDGSSTVEPVTVAAANQFAEEGYSGNITVGESGTGGGFKAFCEDLVTDIADASRPIRSSGDPANPNELEKCQANGREPIPFRVGTDGLTIVVNPANDFATDLTTDEVVTLFSTAVNWSDVRADFPAEPIIRYIPGTDSGTYDFFVEHFYESDGAPVQAATALNQSENDNVLVQGVSENQYAVGFFGYAYYIQNADILKAVALDGVLPSGATVESGAYALSRPLFIYSTAAIMAEKPQVADFINYYVVNANDLASGVGYFPSSAAVNNRNSLWWLAATGGM